MIHHVRPRGVTLHIRLMSIAGDPPSSWSFQLIAMQLVRAVPVELLRLRYSLERSVSNTRAKLETKGVDLTGLLGGTYKKTGVWGTEVPQRGPGVEFL